MVGSVVDVCNLALGYVGSTRAISSLSERSKEAQDCARYYDHARRRTLRDNDWPFARVIEPLTLVDAVPRAGFGLAYAYPPDTLAFRRIEPMTLRSAGFQTVRYEIVAGRQGAGRIIMTDAPAAVGRWTFDQQDVLAFDETFVSALAWALASDIAVPLTRDRGRQRDAANAYTAMLDIAKRNTANEEPRRINDDAQAEWIRARP